jgi:hypothetical protein
MAKPKTRESVLPNLRLKVQQSLASGSDMFRWNAGPNRPSRDIFPHKGERPHNGAFTDRNAGKYDRIRPNDGVTLQLDRAALHIAQLVRHSWSGQMSPAHIVHRGKSRAPCDMPVKSSRSMPAAPIKLQ